MDRNPFFQAYPKLNRSFMLSARNSIQPDMNVEKFSKFLFRDRVFCDKTSSGLKGAVSGCSTPVHPKWLLLLRLRK